MRHPYTFALALIVLAICGRAVHAQSTNFSYQGQLTQANQPATGLFDMRFRLYDSGNSTTPIGSAVCIDNVTVADGRFTAMLDFGPQFRSTSDRFLEIDVRADTGLTCANTTGFTTLAPRQVVSPTPRATAASVANGLVSPNGLVTNAVGVANTGFVGIGTTSPATSLHILTNAAGEGARIQGAIAGVSNQAYLSFYNGGATRVGYVGDGSTGDNAVFLDSDAGDVVLNTAAGRVVNVTPTGRVGVNTGSPQATLDVNGNIRVAPTIRWKSIHGSAFIPQYLDNASFGTQGGMNIIDSFGTGNSGTVGDTGSSGPAYYFAPVELPDGCTVLDICVDGRDSHASQDIVLSLGKVTLSSGFVTEVATTFTSGNTGGSVIQHACNGAVSETIDNSSNVYFLRCRMATSGSSTHWLVAARLKYSVTSPLP